ncbi:MAG: hypothetical protein BM564_01080 [Bacteroidetes bacterium MedPE-SWsnd-G2]|nr:MAG: hypothetical protein BM564_01080 [Bacteroidetes bacterium MedPE-SWsnd-G2]
MNTENATEKLNQFKSDAKIWWDEHTSEAISKYEGNKEKISSYFQEQKGILKEQADKDVEKFEAAKAAFNTKLDDVNSEIKTKWDKFTHEDLAEINGKFDVFADKLKEKYNHTQEEANQKIKDFMSKF